MSGDVSQSAKYARRSFALSAGSGFASSLEALERYYETYGDLWERQTLTRARVVSGDPRLARAVRRALRQLVFGEPLPAASVKEIVTVRKPVLDPKKLDGIPDLFRVKERPSILLVSETLLEKLRNSDFELTNFVATRVEGSS